MLQKMFGYVKSKKVMLEQITLDCVVEQNLEQMFLRQML